MNILIETDKTTSLVNSEKILVVTDAHSNNIVVESPNTNNVVLESSGNVRVEDAITNIIVASGGQGPQGIPGQSLTHIYMTSGASLNGHRVVIPDASGNVVHPVVLTETDVVVGITLGAVNAGDVAEIQIAGTITEPSWNWTLGLPIFVGANGILTQSVPTSGIIQIVAYPILSNRILIDKQQPIIIG